MLQVTISEDTKKADASKQNNSDGNSNNNRKNDNSDSKSDAKKSDDKSKAKAHERVLTANVVMYATGRLPNTKGPVPFHVQMFRMLRMSNAVRWKGWDWKKWACG